MVVKISFSSIKTDLCDYQKIVEENGRQKATINDCVNTKNPLYSIYRTRKKVLFYKEEVIRNNGGSQKKIRQQEENSYFYTT